MKKDAANAKKKSSAQSVPQRKVAKVTKSSAKAVQRGKVAKVAKKDITTAQLLKNIYNKVFE